MKGEWKMKDIDRLLMITNLVRVSSYPSESLDPSVTRYLPFFLEQAALVSNDPETVLKLKRLLKSARIFSFSLLGRVRHYQLIDPFCEH